MPPAKEAKAPKPPFTATAVTQCNVGYNRHRDLPRLVPLLAADLHTPTTDRHLRLLGLIRRALRQERCRGLKGDWTYDLARHAALLAAYRTEYSRYQLTDQPASAPIQRIKQRAKSD